MKILLQINTSINSGSTGRIAEEIGKLAMANGWVSYIAAGRTINISQSHYIKIGNTLSVYWHVLMTRLFDRHGLASLNATKKLIKQIQSIAPDVIHLHNIHGYYINYKILFDYLRNANIPVVWTLHDCWAYTGHCTYYSFSKCDKWKLQCSDCINKKDYPKSLLFDRSYKNYREKKNIYNLPKSMILVPVSKWLAKELEESFLYKYPIKQIHNGIDLDLFKPVQNDIKKNFSIENKFLILGVAGVWSNRKGLSDFISLSKMVSSDMVIMLIGLNKKQIKSLPSNIIGLQRTDNVLELAEIYSTADVFVNPTWEDNYPTTNLESIACGTPVITYRTGGSIESVTDQTGFIVEQGDIKDLFFLIETIKNKGKQVYFQACRNYAINHFNKNECYNEYLSLYETTIK